MDLFGGNKNEQTKILLEPIGTLFTDWQMARSLDNKEGRAKEILEAYRQGHMLHDSLLAQILGETKTPNRKTSLINSSPLALFGEKRSYELSGRAWQFVFGVPSEVKPLFYDRKIFDQAQQAMENGFLPFIVLESAAKGPNPKFGYVDTLLFEPKLTNYQIDDKEIRLLSVLPCVFLNYYSDLSKGLTKLSMNADELLALTPSQVEAAVKDFWAIGSANLRDRYQLITILQARGFKYKYVSKNPEDEDLTK